MIRLISFEGGDGSGKTTQLGLLKRYLASQGRSCLMTREPGGTALGKMIRKALIEGGKEEIAYQTELFLYLADRAQHVREVIQPAMKNQRFVLCDRFSDSTVAYQGYGRGVDLAFLQRMNRLASCGIEPDLTLLLDCPVEIALSRTVTRAATRKSGKKREDRFEKEDIQFHERVRRGFLKLAKAAPERIVVLDASAPALQLHGEIKAMIDQRLTAEA